MFIIPFRQDIVIDDVNYIASIHVLDDKTFNFIVNGLGQEFHIKIKEDDGNINRLKSALRSELGLTYKAKFIEATHSIQISPHHKLINLKESYVLHKTKQSDDKMIQNQLIDMNNRLSSLEKHHKEQKDLSLMQKQMVDMNNRLSQLEKHSDKPKDYNKYKNLFSHPSSEKITIDRSMHEAFKLMFKQHDMLHQFLVDIDYEPYMAYVSDKKIRMTNVFCNEFVRYVSVYLTFQSYINKLKCDAPYNYYHSEKYMIYYNNDALDITFCRHYDNYIKYDICIQVKDKTPESYKYGYDYQKSYDCTLYAKLTLCK
jgi:hypothetical protein